MKKLMPKPKGFTIIEVIIVLVVGAVIMVAVFLVVPQLQQQSRNSQRQALLRRVLVAARQYTLQNNTQLSGTYSQVTSAIESIAGTLPKDPKVNTTNYIVAVSTTGSGNFDSTIYLAYDKKCENNTFSSSTYTGSIAATISLEPYKDKTGSPGRYEGQLFCIND